jgi:addiction module RelE/StbE family toxin
MVEIKWTNFAIENLKEIGDHIEKDSLKYAEIVVNSLFDSTEILEQYPLSGRVVPEFNDNNIRELIRGSYRIVYRILNENRIDILTIHHSARLFFAHNLQNSKI